MGVADSADGNASFELNVARSEYDRACLLGWLERFQRDLADVERDEEVLRLQGGAFRMEVSRASGFVSLASDNGNFEVRLRECHLDEPFDEELATLPDAAWSVASDSRMTEEMRNAFIDPLRRSAFLRVETQLADELISGPALETFDEELEDARGR